VGHTSAAVTAANEVQCAKESCYKRTLVFEYGLLTNSASMVFLACRDKNTVYVALGVI